MDRQAKAHRMPLLVADEPGRSGEGPKTNRGGEKTSKGEKKTQAAEGESRENTEDLTE